MKQKISVVTATRNVAHTITALYASLLKQDYTNFEWIVADGCSTDGTRRCLQQFSSESPWVKVISEPDHGIYHALNKGIARSTGDYYLVVGADDLLDASALTNYANAIGDGVADVILAHVLRAGRNIGGFYPGRRWIGPSRIFAGSHSVGTLIKRSLHERFGYYSRRFPLLADAYFLKVLLGSNSVRFVSTEFVAGTFAEGGATTGNQLQLLAENWQIQMLTEKHPLLQTALFAGKVLLRYRTIAAELRFRNKQLTETHE